MTFFDSKGNWLYATYVNEEGKAGIAVVDLVKGFVVRTIEPENFKLHRRVWDGHLVVSGSKAFVLTLTAGCGLSVDAFGCIDMDKGTYTPFEAPETGGVSRLAPGPHGTWFLCQASAGEGGLLVHYDANGQVLRTINGIRPWEILGTLADSLVVARGTEVHIVSWAS